MKRKRVMILAISAVVLAAIAVAIVLTPRPQLAEAQGDILVDAVVALEPGLINGCLTLIEAEVSPTTFNEAVLALKEMEKEEPGSTGEAIPLMWEIWDEVERRNKTIVQARIMAAEMIKGGIEYLKHLGEYQLALEFEAAAADCFAQGGDPEPMRSPGYWMQQYGQQDLSDFESAALERKLLSVDIMSNVFNAVVNAHTIELAYQVLDAAHNQGIMEELFDRELLAAWLNFANGGIAYNKPLDTDGDGIEDTPFFLAVYAAEEVRLNPAATRNDLEAAKDLLEWINLMDEGAE